MSHLTCKAHKRRTLVLSEEKQIHRDGSPCNGYMLMLGGIIYDRPNVVKGLTKVEAASRKLEKLDWQSYNDKY